MSYSTQYQVYLRDGHWTVNVSCRIVHLILCAIWHDTLTVQWPSRKYTWYCVLYDTTRWQSSDHHVSTLDTVWYMTLSRWQSSDHHVSTLDTVCYITTRWQSSDHHVSTLDTVCYMTTTRWQYQWPSRKSHLILCAIWHDTLTVWPYVMYTWYCVLYDTTRWQSWWSLILSTCRVTIAHSIKCTYVMVTGLSTCRVI